MRIIRRADMQAMPWKNGGGVTHQVAAHPPGAGLDGFDWRISLAEVAADGPFSGFTGVDRTLTVLEGAGMALDFGAGVVDLAPAAPPMALPGEARVAARLHAGPILDLNVMTRRGVLRHAVTVLAAGAPLPPGCTALVCRGAAMRIGAHKLMPGDCALLPPDAAAAVAPDAVTPQGAGQVIAIWFWGMDARPFSGEYQPS